eukprot:g6456.t1
MECHHWQIWRWLFWALEVQNGFRMCFALADERATVPRGAAADLLRAVAQAERFEAALLDCRKALQVCEASPREGLRDAMHVAGGEWNRSRSVRMWDDVV